MDAGEVDPDPDPTFRKKTGSGRQKKESVLVAENKFLKYELSGHNIWGIFAGIF